MTSATSTNRANREQCADLSTREIVLRLRDELMNGVKYDRKRNVYILVWTNRQLRNARRRANRLYKKLRFE